MQIFAHSGGTSIRLWKKIYTFLFSNCLAKFIPSKINTIKIPILRNRMCLLDSFMQKIHTFLFGNCLAKFIPFKINAKKRSRYFGIECVYWWSLSGSNRWPPACKAGALPAELKPHVYLNSMVGLNGLEPTTSPLSGVRSNHLSYRPVSIECPYIIPWDI